MKVFRVVLAQCAVLGIALGAVDPPPLPSYHFGITGEPTKVDTAFGNLGEVGPAYSAPETHNGSTVSSSGKSEIGNTDGPIKQGTKSPLTVKPITAASTGNVNNSNNVGDITKAKTTDGEEIMLPESESALNGTTEKEMEPSAVSNPTQTFETTTFSKEQPTTTTTGSSNNSSGDTATEEATTNRENSSTPSSSFANPSNTSSSTQGIQGSTTRTIPGGLPNQTFHTGSPNSTDSPMNPHVPGYNEMKPGQNLTLPTKPNSSVPLYKGKVFLTLAVISFYAVNKL